MLNIVGFNFVICELTEYKLFLPMHIKRSFLGIILIVGSATTYSQVSGDQYILSAGGNKADLSTGHSMTWTLGELIIETGIQTELNDYTQGFHQPYIDVTVIEDSIIDLNINVFPNPAIAQLNMRYNKFKQGDVLCLYDEIGKLLLIEQIIDANMILPFEAYSTGIYYLVILNKDNEKIKTFKVQKSH